MNEVWPNFFIIGTSRGGTTSLYNYLEGISEIYLAPRGETGYFFPKIFQESDSKKKYLRLFENFESKKARGEYAGYLEYPESAQLIKTTIPDAKIIISLRDPIERAFSHYLGALRSHDEFASFDETFKKYMMPINEESDFYNHYIKPGRYYENVKMFLDVFGKKNVKIIIFEEFTNDTHIIFREVLDFLGIDAEIPPNVGKTYNAYAEPLGKVGTTLVQNKSINKFAKKILPAGLRVALLRLLTNKRGGKPEILDNHKKILEEFYKDDSKKLEKLLGYKLPWIFLK